ncbi:hypothetical protein KS08_10560 [Bacillus subtilis]|nr:hypothetical protein LL3_02282 [Bacillus amyloliquefaciens LL3]AEK88487.1 hypothetical protein; phage SPbeta [Bacillus amyloliquefaciens XH7]AIW35902.1 hypothetical protein KS08_10560 [Bacillus subtilis]QDP94418.1 hypothetical protein FOG69_10130 [Bacillus amyloliquefaciens]RDB54216.1 hypothetical protein DT062_06625 [Bacillus subtilis subsp. subtilis]
MKDLEDGYFIKIDDADVYIVRTLDREYAAKDKHEVILIDLSTLQIAPYKDMKELKSRLSDRGSTVEVIRPKQANVNIGFERRQ